MEKVANHICPRCQESQLNIYLSYNTDVKIGAWCEYCNLKGYFNGEQLISLSLYC